MDTKNNYLEEILDTPINKRIAKMEIHTLYHEIGSLEKEEKSKICSIVTELCHYRYYCFLRNIDYNSMPELDNHAIVKEVWADAYRLYSQRKNR